MSFNEKEVVFSVFLIRRSQWMNNNECDKIWFGILTEITTNGIVYLFQKLNEKLVPFLRNK